MTLQELKQQAIQLSVPERVALLSAIAQSLQQDLQMQPEPQPVASWDDDPFVGMWRDREDLSDSTEWVRHLRQQEWG